jgi:hypothetical protein
MAKPGVRFPQGERQAARSRASFLVLLAVVALVVALVGWAILRSRSRPSAADRSGPDVSVQADADAVREQNAEVLFARAKIAASMRSWRSARENLARLKKDYSKTSFFKINQAAIAELARTIGERPRRAPSPPEAPPDVRPFPPRPIAPQRPARPDPTPDELHAALKAKNPGYTGGAHFVMRKGKCVSVSLVRCRVADLSPLACLTPAKFLCVENQVADLSPLAGMPIEELYCRYNQIENLAPLADMPLRILRCEHNRIADLSPLRGKRLWKLACHSNRIADLSPLRGMPLEALECGDNRIADLSPLRGMPLRRLLCSRNRIADLSPLAGMRLEALYCAGNPISDLSPLRGVPLKYLECADTRVTDIWPLAGSPLRALGLGGLAIRDPSILRDLPLHNLAISPDRIAGDLGFLRHHKTLWTIGADCTLKYAGDVAFHGDGIGMFLDAIGGKQPAIDVQRLDERDRKRLAAKTEQRVSFNFADTSLGDVAEDLGERAGVAINLDPRIFKDDPLKVTLRVDDGRLDDALSRICKPLGLVWLPLDGAVFITTPALAKKEPERTEELRRLQEPSPEDLFTRIRLLQRLKFTFVETPLRDMFQFFEGFRGVTLVWDPRVSGRERLTVNATFSGRDMRLDQALRWACRTAGMVCVWRDGAMLVTRPEHVSKALDQDKQLRQLGEPPTEQLAARVAKRIYFEFRGTLLPEALSVISEQGGLPIELDRGAVGHEARPLDLCVYGMRLDWALTWVCRQAGMVYVWRDGKILVTTPERARKASRGVPEEG